MQPRGRESRWHLVAALTCLALSVLAFTPSRAVATYSLIATDPARGEVGAAGASCVPYEVISIYEVAPGHGALVAQANFDDAAQAAGLDLLLAGEPAAAVLAQLSDASMFSQAPKMQYGVVDAGGGVATFTGPEALPVAFDQQREVGAFRVGALGNVLTSELVLEQALDGFESGGCDLAERLMVGLEAASNGGEGDNRCTPDGRPANSAFLDVTGGEGGEGNVVRISIPDVSPESPIPALRAAFDEWRADHPCEPVGGNGAGGEGGGIGAGGNGAGASEADGCACRASAAPLPQNFFVLGLLAIARRRSRRRSRAQC
jgi:uncharacterized Ntn-hydrolase superfamily protein